LVVRVRVSVMVRVIVSQWSTIRSVVRVRVRVRVPPSALKPDATQPQPLAQVHLARVRARG